MNKKLFKTILNSKIFFGILVSTLFFTSCNNSNKEDEKLGISIITSGLKYCEGSVSYGNDLLVSTFGCETFNPLNEEGRGYIFKIQGDKVFTLIRGVGY